MKKVLRYALMSFAIATFAFASEANAQVSEILKRMDAYNKNLSSLKADVTMKKFNPQLNTTDILIGSTILVQKCKSKKQCIRLDWKTENGRPKNESVSVIADDYELYTGGSRNQVVYGKVNKAKGSPQAGSALAFMNMSRAQLKANYDIAYLGQEKLSTGRDVWHLELTPKATNTYKAAEIWVDSDGMPRQAKVIERNGDTTTVLLTNDVPNQKINTSVFQLNYPDNVKKIPG